ncbi:hypothetical protein EBR04_00335 [bacterium]|nr:hypothetical protein [bacterium]
MPMGLSRCATILTQDGVRHHVDAEEAAIRAVFVTREYRNPRGERLAIVRIETPDDGFRCRVSIDRAFAIGPDPSATCLALCRMAADTPLVGIEYDEPAENLRLVIEAIIEDGDLTRLQLLSMVDRLVEAAEVWHAAFHAGATSSARGGLQRPRANRGAA